MLSTDVQQQGTKGNLCTGGLQPLCTQVWSLHSSCNQDRGRKIGGKMPAVPSNTLAAGPSGMCCVTSRSAASRVSPREMLSASCRMPSSPAPWQRAECGCTVSLLQVRRQQQAAIILVKLSHRPMAQSHIRHMRGLCPLVWPRQADAHNLQLVWLRKADAHKQQQLHAAHHPQTWCAPAAA